MYLKEKKNLQYHFIWEGDEIHTRISMRSFIGNLLFAGVLLLIATRFLSVITGTAFPVDIVTSNSMSPLLMEGDLVAWTPCSVEDVEEGDVIVFKSWLSWPGEKLLVHRVVDIHESWGKIALETKGDANTYTDQAGPHIPEPHVTEKNFIGKALSIGKIPLKIPFVGVIGLWINQGFNLLSQPSAGRGTFTNIGVFTPLTISVILLVISFFILPENIKKRSVREKIRLYIFGSEELSVKKFYMIFLAIFVTLLLLIHFFAYDTVSSSVGIGEFPEDSELAFGAVSPGSKSIPKHLPIINPSVLPVKGMVIGDGKLQNLIEKRIFSVDAGGSKETEISACIPNGTRNGSYFGQVMVYSSPLWLMYPDEFMQLICDAQAGTAVFMLDVLSAVILTSLIILLMVGITYLGNKYRLWEIDISWCHTHKLFLKKGLFQRCISLKRNMKKFLGKKIGWILSLDLMNIDLKLIVLSTVIIIPIYLFFSSEILAMVVASISAGLIAYFMKCKLRNKIVLASVVTMIFNLSLIIIKTNYKLISTNRSIIESMSLGMGAVGIYFIALAFLLIPIAIATWYITSKMRNVKEQKDPLLMLEGRCDL
jgi:signal peptidase I